MGTVHATPQDVFDAIQELHAQRSAADVLMAGPHVPGRTDLWKRKTADLLRVALPDDHYAHDTFQRAGLVSTRMAPPMSSPAQRDAVFLENDRKVIAAHLPSLEDAIAEAEKRLQRMGGGGLAATPSPAGGTLPRVRFGFVKDPKLEAIAQRDYDELRVAIFYGSHKSKSTLAGSVVEAVVLDLLLQKPVPFAELERLTAHGLYERAKKEGILAGRSSSAADASRDVRNFVHPAVEYREGSLTSTQADLGVSLMQAVLGELGVI